MRNLPSSHRQQKAASVIHQAIIEALRKGNKMDTRLLDNPFIVTSVKVSADLKKAYCYFVPFNTNLSSTEIDQALKNSKHSIRNYVTHFVKLKYSPDIVFEFDSTYDNLRKIDHLLNEERKKVE